MRRLRILRWLCASFSASFIVPAWGQAAPGPGGAEPSYRVVWSSGEADYAIIDQSRTRLGTDGVTLITVTRQISGDIPPALLKGSDDSRLGSGPRRTAVVDLEIACEAEKLRIVGYAYVAPGNQVLPTVAGELALHLSQSTEGDALIEAACRQSGLAGSPTLAGALDQVEIKAERRLLDNKLLVASVSQAPSDPGALREEAFAAAQWAMTTEAAAALANVAARFSKGTSPIAELERRRAALADKRQRKARAYLLADRGLSADAADAAIALAKEISALDDALAEIDRSIDQTDPAYSELARPTPLTIVQVQQLLRPDEGILLMLVNPDATYLFGISSDKVEWARSDGLGETSLSKKIEVLRQQAQHDVLYQEITFDRTRAYELYRGLVSPVEGAFVGKTKLMTVGTGPLDSLPMQMLVAKPPVGSDSDPASVQASAWLGDKYALSVLPSISSLRALRCFISSAPGQVRGCPNLPAGQHSGIVASAGALSLVGIGAPLLDGPSPSTADVEGAASDDYARAFDDDLADPDFLRKLPFLDGSAKELASIARIVGPEHAQIMSGAGARERDVKASPAIVDARLLVFSTHGLLASESGVRGEPGLVLTPPLKADRSEMDDGLLTASEAAQLKLSADFVVLSACNTAGPDGRPQAEGLSGLARAFLFAGARSLVVSHWEVSDETTVPLMSSIFSAVTRDPRVNRAVALQQAMQAVRSNPDWASPGLWAPFVLIGLGQ